MVSPFVDGTVKAEHRTDSLTLCPVFGGARRTSSPVLVGSQESKPGYEGCEAT